MPWCPNCKYEYKEGFTSCADCGAELVDTLTTSENNNFDPNENLYEDWVSNDSYKKDMEEEDTYSDFEDSDLNLEDSDLKDSNDASKNKPSHESATYTKKSDLQKEMSSSAYTFLIVGIAGLIGLILVIFGIIPLQFSSETRFFVYGVMGLMFVAFIGIGIVSLKRSNILLEEAKTEDTLTTSLLDWFRTSYNASEIDQDCSFDGSSPAELYFKRTEVMKQLICKQYLDLNEVYLDQLIDDLYQEMWQD